MICMQLYKAQEMMSNSQTKFYTIQIELNHRVVFVSEIRCWFWWLKEFLKELGLVWIVYECVSEN